MAYAQKELEAEAYREARDPKTQQIDLLRLPPNSKKQQLLRIAARCRVNEAVHMIHMYSPLLEYRTLALGDPQVGIFPLRGGPCPTAQVSQSARKINDRTTHYQEHMTFNASWVLNHTAEDVVAVYLHESLHLLFEHLARMKKYNLRRKMPMMGGCTVWNYVTDILINETILKWYHMHGVTLDDGTTLAEHLNVPEAKDLRWNPNETHKYYFLSDNSIEFNPGRVPVDATARRNTITTLRSKYITWDDFAKRLPSLAAKFPRKSFWGYGGLVNTTRLYHEVVKWIDDHPNVAKAPPPKKKNEVTEVNNEFPLVKGRLVKDSLTGKIERVVSVEYDPKDKSIKKVVLEPTTLTDKDLFNPKYNLKNF